MFSYNTDDINNIKNLKKNDKIDDNFFSTNFVNFIGNALNMQSDNSTYGQKLNNIFLQRNIQTPPTGLYISPSYHRISKKLARGFEYYLNIINDGTGIKNGESIETDSAFNNRDSVIIDNFYKNHNFDNDSKLKTSIDKSFDCFFEIFIPFRIEKYNIKNGSTNQRNNFISCDNDKKFIINDDDQKNLFILYMKIKKLPKVIQVNSNDSGFNLNSIQDTSTNNSDKIDDTCYDAYIYNTNSLVPDFNTFQSDLNRYSDIINFIDKNVVLNKIFKKDENKIKIKINDSNIIITQDEIIKVTMQNSSNNYVLTNKKSFYDESGNKSTFFPWKENEIFKFSTCIASDEFNDNDKIINKYVDLPKINNSKKIDFYGDSTKDFDIYCDYFEMDIRSKAKVMMASNFLKGYYILDYIPYFLKGVEELTSKAGSDEVTIDLNIICKEIFERIISLEISVAEKAKA